MLITRYLFKNLFSVTAFIAITLTLVIWLTQSLKLLELVANSDAPPGLFIKLVLLTLPRFLEVILPLALVTAVLFIYNKFIMDNELIVLRACGFDQMALARPALILAGGLTVVLILLTTWISPASYNDMKQLRRTVKAQYSGFLLREGVFNTFNDDLTVYVRERDANGDLLGLMIHDRRERDKPPVTVTAKRGRIVMDGDTPNILVFEGLRQQMDTQSHVVSRLFFSRYMIEIKGLESDPVEKWRHPSERTFIELLHPDMANKRDVENLDEFRTEAHERILTPLNAIGFTLISLAFVLLGPFNRRGLTRKIIAAVTIVVMLQALNMGAVNAAKKQPDMLILLYLVTLLPIGSALFMLHSRGEQWLTQILRRLRLRKYATAKGGVA
ncbi:MAG TPA: LPS export ABC transporter permease LptF [Alphaproteobacteria bacterium]|nr:LPS export ABC transporter permease LptF [Alphaproteobacteria bacterium]